MALFIGTFILLTSWVSGTEGVTRYISHVQNYVKLVSAYYTAGYSTIDMPPISNISQTMKVNVGVSVFAINGFDEVAGNIELVAALNMSWTDQMPVITSITFNIQDRESFLVPYEMIWTPKLVLKNAVGDSSEVGDSAYLCRFNMRTNIVVWNPRVVISGACTPDITYYPFDRQTCSFIYTPWGFTSEELMLEASKTEWDMSSYKISGEWEVANTETVAYNENNQSYLLLTITIIRKPLYFAFNIVIPVLVLCLLNGAVFLLPAESGERVGFSVTCFLSFVVLLNMIMDILPRSSSPISFLCYYLVVMMCSSGAMTLVTILLMRVYHKPDKTEVPKWMQRSVTFINCGCARLKCCVLCFRFLKRKCSCKTNAAVVPKSDEKDAERIHERESFENKVNKTMEVHQESCGCFMMCKRKQTMTDSLESDARAANKRVKFKDNTEQSDDTKAASASQKNSGARRQSLKSSSLGRRYSKSEGRKSVNEGYDSKRTQRETDSKTLSEVEILSIDSDVDSLAELEEEVKWAEVGRICDTFFFLVFTGGQIFFTIVFLVPLFTATSEETV